MKRNRKFVKQFVSLLLVGVSSLLPVISAEALYSDYPGRWNVSAYDSEMGRNVANIAKAQDTKTGGYLGYASNWCAKFVMDCGERAGTTALNPPQTGKNSNMWVPDYYINLLRAGGREVSFWEARAGDIAFFDLDPKENNGIDHVEIVYDVSNGIVYTVGGNTGNTRNTSTNKVNKRTIPGSARAVQGNIAKIVRPNYYSVKGDVNGDGRVNASDAQVIINAILDKGAQLTAEQNSVADVDGNGKVNVADAQQIINNVLGK